ncbi:MAG: hypothetical protein Q9213_004060 [Squamulea squamosa]
MREQFKRLPKSLPPVPVQTLMDAWHEQLRLMKRTLVNDIAECNEVDDYELPLELQPVLQEDDLPQLDDIDDKDIIWDTGEHTDWDSLDIKNSADLDPDQDPEREYYTNDVRAWIRADEQQSLMGARPRLYERLNLPNRVKKQIFARKTTSLHRHLVSFPSPLYPA